MARPCGLLTNIFRLANPVWEFVLITKLNLSSHPFRNRRLPYLLSGAMVFFALVGGLYSVTIYRSVSNQNTAGNVAIKELEAEIAELRGKGEKVQKSLSPQQRELMIAGHKLVATKEFGWSRLLYDIERILPADVSASRISVENIYKEGGTVSAELEFAVLSRNYVSVVNMIQRMNESGIFRASLRSQDRQESERQQYTEYTMLLTYRPSAGFSTTPATDVASAVTEGGAE